MTEKSDASNPESSRPAPGWITAFAVAALVLVCITFVLFILHHYFVKAYSDPLNGLDYAKNLGAEFSHSRFPAGYAIYLWFILKLVGPYCAFLANLPVLVVLAILIATIAGKSAARTESAVEARLVGVVAMAMFLRFDLYGIVYLANPYRDPLSYIFMISSALLFMSYLRSNGHTPMRLFIAGLLLGPAYFIKEPSVLIAVPLFLLGLITWITQRNVPFWKSCLLFGAGLAIGLLPAMIQTYAITNQIVIPHYIIKDGTAHGTLTIPSMSLQHLAPTLEAAATYYWKRGGALHAVLFLLGVFHAIRRKNTPFLALIIPAVLFYTLFYGCYRGFGFRYFHVVTVFAAPVVAYGILGTAELAARLRPLRKLTPHILALTTAVVVTWVLWDLKPVGRSIGEFKIHHARALTTAIESIVPKGSTVYCHRHLNEILSWFIDREARSPESLLVPVLVAHERCYFDSDRGFRDGIAAEIAAGHPPFYLEAPSDYSGNIGFHLIGRYYDLVAVAHFPTADYGLTQLNGNGDMILYRIQERTNTLTRAEIMVPKLDPAVLRVSTGTLEGTGVLKLNDRRLDAAADGGVDYYAVNFDDFEAPYVLELSSEHPVPAALDVTVMSPSDSIFLDFGVLSRYCHDDLLSESILERVFFDCSARDLLHEGTVRLPVVADGPAFVFAKIRMTAVPHPTADPVTVQLRHEGNSKPLAVCVVPKDWSSYDFPFTFESKKKEGEFDIISLTVNRTSELKPGRNAQVTDSDILRIDGLHIVRVPVSDTFVIDVGSPTDDLFLGEGFHHRESAPEGTVRWTSERVSGSMYLEERDRDVAMAVTHWKKYRPEDAGEINPRILVNGIEVEGTEMEEPASPGLSVIRTLVPYALLGGVSNSFELIVNSWRPDEITSSADTRELGVMVDEISFRYVDVE
jgi:hypothetical protein